MLGYLSLDTICTNLVSRAFSWLGALGTRLYLFLVAHSFLRASLSENCSLLGKDNVRGQISEQIFSPQMPAIVYLSPTLQPLLEASRSSSFL